MEDILNSILLGIVQGLTEFLPVSSSGHLELAKAILGEDKVGEESMMMTVVLHAATALSTIVIFRKDIAEIIKGLFTADLKSPEKIFSLKIVISMIPAAVVGVAFKDELEELFTGKIALVGTMLLITGLLLFLSERARKTDKSVSFVHAIIIGIAQAIAILPGISRSGSTIATAVILGIDKEKAARFSFLMVVPLILGKMAKDIMDGAFASDDVNLIPLIVGFIAAFLTGLLACQWMISIVKKSKLSWFAIYCFIVGAIAVFMAW